MYVFKTSDEYTFTKPKTLRQDVKLTWASSPNPTRGNEEVKILTEHNPTLHT